MQLTCQNLSVGYDGRTVLTDLNFSVSAGDYLCIVGENGSGKSTLMKTILGLQPPCSGKILTGSGLRKNEIGYLPQQTAIQMDFPASVSEIVRSGCQGRVRLAPLLRSQGTAACRKRHGENANHRPGTAVLPGTFRRTAATGAAGEGAVRRGKNTAAGRTGFRP